MGIKKVETLVYEDFEQTFSKKPGIMLSYLWRNLKSKSIMETIALVGWAQKVFLVFGDLSIGILLAVAEFQMKHFAKLS